MKKILIIPMSIGVKPSFVLISTIGLYFKRIDAILKFPFWETLKFIENRIEFIKF